MRERREDIPLLARHFADRQAEVNGLPRTDFSADALNFLSRLPYPGNIRELKNLVERTILVSGKPVLDATDFDAQYLRHDEPAKAAEGTSFAGMTLDEIERQTILQALEQHKGNLSQVAVSLGISRAALYRRLEKYNIQVPCVIKFFFFILVLFLLGLGGMLVYLLSGKPSLYLYVLEGLIGFILIYLIVFYNKIVKPMNTIGSGMELLREQDFSSRLSRVGQYEADRIVNIFNRMMEQLKNERLRMREQNHFLDLLIQASPMGVIILTMDDEVSQLNPMAVKMLGVRMEEAMAKRLDQMDSPLAAELSSIPKDETAVVRLNDANIYKCTILLLLTEGSNILFLDRAYDGRSDACRERAYER